MSQNRDNSHEPPPSRGRSDPYNESELASLRGLKKADLIERCTTDGFDLTGTTTIATIFDRIKGRPEPSRESASAKAKLSRSSSARPVSPSSSLAGYASERSKSHGRHDPPPHFTATTSGKRSPTKRQEMVEDDPEFQLKAERERRKHAWGVKTKKDGQPWTNMATLQHIFDTEMMPSSPIASSSLKVVILVGPAASGKSSALERVDLGLTDHNTVRVDPDKIYEWLAGKYGYVPPEIKEIEDVTQYPSESDEKYKHRSRENRDRLTKQYTDRLAWWLENKDTFDEQYGREFREFEDVRTRDFKAAEFCTPKTSGVLGQYGVVLPSMEQMIFKGATKAGLNVILDTTGGMKGTFLEGMAKMFIGAKYKVVVVLVVSSKEDCIARVSGPGGRNAQQHRKLDDCIVGQIWRNFVTEKTSCRWEHFSREQRTEFVVLQNTGTQTNKVDARVVYRRKPDGSIAEPVGLAELSHILGTYNVTTDSETGGFLCRGGGAAGSASASKGRGGSSRKRRISRRRIHGSRARKTIKKYTRPLSRRRRHH